MKVKLILTSIILIVLMMTGCSSKKENVHKEFLNKNQNQRIIAMKPSDIKIVKIKKNIDVKEIDDEYIKEYLYKRNIEIDRISIEVCNNNKNSYIRINEDQIMTILSQEVLVVIGSDAVLMPKQCKRMIGYAEN